MAKSECKNNTLFRPAAVPLITVDPYFSVWSFEDELYTDYTRHWSGRTNPMFAGVLVDGEYFAAMGVADSRENTRHRNSRHLEQKDKRITPLKTVYIFESKAIRLTLTFLTPLLLDRLDILSRTASYIEYDIESIDAAEHDTIFVFGIAGACCVSSWEQNIKFGRTEKSVFVGNAQQDVLSKSGDTVCVEWGYLHVADNSARIVNDISVNWHERLSVKDADKKGIYNAFGENPYILLEKKEKHAVITLGYDEVKPIEYFGEQLDEYYNKYFSCFDEMLTAAAEQYTDIKKLCDCFEKNLINEASNFGEKYTKIISLAYRQAVGAHKIVEDKEGNLLFLSKECFSNGCIGTLDITYPSMPLFLKFNPQLVLGMLRPIIRYACSDAWEFDFAPHDVGQYPLANGQVYGDNKIEYQMPVEECGNMLIAVAACEKMIGNTDFAEENKAILKKWADYLLAKGFNPENQLCTDDFAGHMEHNCNLGIKGILGAASYGSLFGDKTYTDRAKEMAQQWSTEAVCDYGSRLAFGSDNTWSLKYNMVWDKLLGFGLFDEEIYQKEVRLYMTKMNRYGVPLDSRKSYTKLDWLFWTTVMTDNREYFDMVVDAAYNMINETEDRVPMTDWYDSVTAKQCEFQNRTVVGGIFINLL